MKTKNHILKTFVFFLTIINNNNKNSHLLANGLYRIPTKTMDDSAIPGCPVLAVGHIISMTFSPQFDKISCVAGPLSVPPWLDLNLACFDFVFDLILCQH